jgi:hypothetical protein
LTCLRRSDRPLIVKYFFHDFRAKRSAVFLQQCAMADRNGRMAIKYTMSTISIRPNIALMSMKLGESSATNNAGTNVTIDQIVSLIQLSTGVLRALLIPTAASFPFDFCQRHS